MCLKADKQWAEAEAVLRELIPILEANPDDEETEARWKIAFEKSRGRYLSEFPSHIRRRVSDEQLRRLYDLASGSSWALTWGPGTRQHLVGAQFALAQCLAKQGRADEARDAFAAMEPDEEEDVNGWTRLANAYYDEEMFDEAKVVYRRLEALWIRLGKDPILGFNRTWSSRFTQPMKRLSRILELEGEAVEAADILRTFGDAAAGRLILETAEAWDEAEAAYRARMQAELPGAEAGDEEARNRWRDAGIRLAELLQHRKRWDEALAVYQELADGLVEDYSVSPPSRPCTSGRRRWRAPWPPTRV